MPRAFHARSKTKMRAWIRAALATTLNPSRHRRRHAHVLKNFTAAIRISAIQLTRITTFSNEAKAWPQKEFVPTIMRAIDTHAELMELQTLFG
jgi:hypothetical protein